MSKAKKLEALLVIATALLVLYLYGYIYKSVSKPIFIYLACGIGVSGILIPPLGNLIAVGWYKLSDILGFFMSKLVLSVVFILILVPISFLYKLFKKDKLQIKKTGKTTWIERNYNYTTRDLENIW